MTFLLKNSIIITEVKKKGLIKMDLFKQQSSYTKNQNFCEIDFKPDKKYLKRKLNKKSRQKLKKLLTK